MRVLLLTDRIPYPLANGQNLRLFHFLAHLRASHTFDLVAYGPQPYPKEIVPLFREILTLNAKPPVDPPPRLWRRLSSSLSPDEMFRFDERMRDLILGRLRSETYDLVWISGWDMLVYLPHLPSTPVLADVVDEGVLEQLRILRHPPNIASMLRAGKRAIQTWRFERKYFGAATRCNTVSDLDSAFLRRICPDTPISVVNNGVDIGFFEPCDSPPEPHSLIFEGHMRFAPNVQAVLYFHEEILPEIRRDVPDLTFYVVGKDPAPAVSRLADDGVVVTGYVDDVRPYIARSAVFVCPIRTGAGIKNKILQAWAMGKAVVATPESIGGLRAEDGVNIRVARGGREFAQAVVGLLRDPAVRDALGRKGRETVVDYYNWTRQARMMEEVLQTAAGSRPPRR